MQVAAGASSEPVQFSSRSWKLPTAPPEMTAMKTPPAMLPVLVTSISRVVPSEPTLATPKSVGLEAGAKIGRPPVPLRSALNE